MISASSSCLIPAPTCHMLVSVCVLYPVVSEYTWIRCLILMVLYWSISCPQDINMFECVWTCEHGQKVVGHLKGLKEVRPSEFPLPGTGHRKKVIIHELTVKTRTEQPFLQNEAKTFWAPPGGWLQHHPCEQTGTKIHILYVLFNYYYYYICQISLVLICCLMSDFALNHWGVVLASLTVGGDGGVLSILTYCHLCCKCYLYSISTRLINT